MSASVEENVHRISDDNIYEDSYIDRYGVAHVVRLYGNRGDEWYWEVSNETGTVTAPSSLSSRALCLNAAQNWLAERAQPVEPNVVTAE
jgi:hypothetical protein